MKTRAFVLLCVVALLPGCYRSGRLYPVQGPLASQTAPPIYSFKMTGAFNSGTVTATLADGQVYKGAWTLVSRQPADSGAATAIDWRKVWDAVYGNGFYNANVLGAPLHVRSAMTGTQGTTLNVEFYRRNVPGQMTEIRGVAEDSGGNIYKAAL
ncbi:MAG: hypothetical protein WAL75_12100 [Terracidiphilus sp.]